MPIMAPPVTPEVKLYTLAQQDINLRTALGSNPFRWFDTPLPQGVWGPGKTCLRFRRVSTVLGYNVSGLMNLEAIRYQFEILDQFLETARSVANTFQSFMGQVDLCSSLQFGSPQVQPNQYPCFLLNRRETTDFKLEPLAQIVVVDYRVYNRTDF